MNEDIDNSAERYKAIDLDRNPRGAELKIKQQRIRERDGKFYPVGDNGRTQIFVRNGEDPAQKIEAYRKKIDERTKRWN